MTLDPALLDLPNESLDSSRRMRGRPAYSSLPVQSAMIGATVLTGVAYILLQWVRRGEILDAWFVSMLFAATMLLVAGVSHAFSYLRNKGLAFFLFCCPRQEHGDAYGQHAALCAAVMNSPRMTFAGILYGLGVGAAPLVLGVWKDDTVLMASLGLFMFAVNYVTGIAFYSLIIFFLHSLRMGRVIKVNLWQVSNPATTFVLGATRRISILASLYVAICISSVLFSLLPITGWVIGYSCFSAATILATLVIPTSPIVSKLRLAKEEALLAIDKQIHLTFYENLEETTPKDAQVDFDRVKTLLELREKIEAINIWPFRLKSFATACSVVLFSSIPVLIQFFLEHGIIGIG